MSDHLELVLGGLLHDVGKFSQRAHAPAEGLSGEALGMESLICPLQDGYYTHRHVLYTAQFVLGDLPFLPDGMGRERLTHLAAWHHRPSSPEEQIIAEADRLSSGMEWEEDEDSPSGRGAFRKVRLRAVVNEINLTGQAPGVWAHDFALLDPARAFPSDRYGQSNDLTAEYRALWDSFLTEWSRNRLSDPWAFANRALSVLERYTWCIPSATNAYPDISLFDHLKTTAAIAACLALTQPDCEEPFLLVAGELGGIQKYLFDIRTGPGGLARRLRSRSLFISLVTENTLHRILRQLELPLTNCIFSAGGHFTLLLPNNQAARETLQRTSETLAEWTRKELGCQLHPHLASLPVKREALQDFGGTLERLRERLEQEKARPLQEVLLGNEGWAEESFALDALRVAEEASLCASCQRRAGRLRLVQDREVVICEHCHDDAEMGRRLVNASYIAFSEKPGRLPFGSSWFFQKEDEIPPEAYLAFDLDGGSGELPHKPVVGRYLARFVPRDEDGSVTEFGKLETRARGRQALAYLKADVDNLGLVFREGFRGEERDRRSISRMATLSRSLELFFSGYIQRLAEQSGCVYTIYSGGDDLLLVGPWDEMVGFALQLREDFHRYTCGNPSWSLSAGLVLVGSKTPVLTATAEADECLEAAKHTSGPGILPWPLPAMTQEGDRPSKNRLVAFGTSLPWGRVAEAMTQAQRLLAWLEDKSLSTGQVRRLLTCANLYQEWQRTGDVLCYRYAPMLVYDLRRNWGKAPSEAQEWARGLTVPNSPDMPLLRFICEYALYGARSEVQGSEER